MSAEQEQQIEAAAQIIRSAKSFIQNGVLCGRAESAALNLADAGLLADPAERQRLRDEVERLQRWKDEALPVIAGLQELGKALDTPPGERITGKGAAERARGLVALASHAEFVAHAVGAQVKHERERAEKAEAKVARVLAWADDLEHLGREGTDGIALVAHAFAAEIRAALADDPASKEARS